MKVGIVGAGTVAQAIARYLLDCSHQVVLTSRSPETLGALIDQLGPGASAAAPAAALEADLTILAVPWPNAGSALDGLPSLEGKILVDATNPFASTDPLQLADLGARTASEIIAGYAPGARLVKAFNSITMAHFSAGPRRGDAQRLLLIAGDDAQAKALVRGLIESFGFAVADMGGLVEGGRLAQAGAPLATGRDLLVAP